MASSSTKAEERKDEHDHNDKADEIDETVHGASSGVLPLGVQAFDGNPTALKVQKFRLRASGSAHGRGTSTVPMTAYTACLLGRAPSIKRLDRGSGTNGRACL
jgi:hypothetical protein